MPLLSPHTASKVPRRERVALAQIPGIEPGPEPLHPLRGRAVRKRFRDDVTSRLLLQAIVAHRARRRDARIDILGIDDPALRRRMPPHARETVGLQLEAYRERIAIAVG